MAIATRALTATLCLATLGLATRGAGAPGVEVGASLRVNTADPGGARAMGGLHRFAATIEATLDVHRLALIELVVAVKKVRESGHAEGATPATALPQSAAEVFARLATTVPRRVPIEALPAVPRAYHAEVIDALEQLGRATMVSEIVRPARAYLRAMDNMVAQAKEVIDLYSRARPILTEVIDPNTVLDQVNDALDELERAEAAIARLRERKQALGEQLQAFVRLEVALGHVLDVVAEAQEAGVHIGFEVQLSTANLDKVVQAVRGHLVELDEVVASMEQLPRPLNGALIALIEPPLGDGPKDEATVHVTWPAPEGAAQPAALRLFRMQDKKQAIATLAATRECETGDHDTSAALAKERLGQLETAATQAAEIAPGRGSFTDTLSPSALRVAPPIYRIVPVTPFGVEGEGPQAAALLLPRTLEPPALLSATLAAENPAAAEFYRGADLVRLEWSPSRNELPQRVGGMSGRDLEDFAREHNLPVLRSYRIIRFVDGKRFQVGIADAHEHTALDRPTAEELGRGVSYDVEAVSDLGSVGRDKPCVLASVQADVKGRLELAQLGIARVHHPTARETAALVRLSTPAALASARAAFMARPAPEREQLLAAFWHEIPERDRKKLLAEWPSFVTTDERATYLREGLAHLCERDRAWVQAEIWLATEPPYVQREVDRWWSLLDAKTAMAAAQQWRAKLNPAHRQWLDERLSSGDADVLRPARVLAWWGARDVAERERVDDWWLDTTPDEQRRLFDAWLADQSSAVKEAVRWPVWAALSNDERHDLLAHAYRQLPHDLWPRFLAWLDWHELHGEALRAALQTEVGAAPRMAAKLKYDLRPLDRALAFKLPHLAALGVLILGLLGGLRRRRQQRRG